MTEITAVHKLVVFPNEMSIVDTKTSDYDHPAACDVSPDSR